MSTYFSYCLGNSHTYACGQAGIAQPGRSLRVTAFLLYRNGIIQETDVLDAKTLPKVEMPNRNGFVPATPAYPPEKKPSWW